MKPLFIFLFMVYSACLLAQLDTTIYGMEINANNIKARINSNGSLFYDYETGQGEFFPNYIQGGTNYTTLNNVGLWMGGLDKGGNLKTAAHNIEGGTTSDFAGGIINKDKTGPLKYSNKIWKVTRQQIEAHRKDWKDNGKIDNPIQAIYAWPALGNSHCLANNGFLLAENNEGIDYAHFQDINHDGVYSPELGEYPTLAQNVCFGAMPEEIYWYSFHDFKPHSVSKGMTGHLEIQAEAYGYHCEKEPYLNNSVFVNYFIWNRSDEDIDSFHVGLCADFLIGCDEKNYVGTIHENNTAYAYHSNSKSDSCNEYPPVQAITLFNIHNLKTFNFPDAKVNSIQPILFDDSENGLPQNAAEYYEMLCGNTRKGTLHPKFYYPDPPNKTGISEHTLKNTPGRRRMLMVAPDSRFIASARNDYTFVFTAHAPKVSLPTFAKIDEMYATDTHYEYFWTCDAGIFSCSNFTDTDENTNQNTVSIFPNPAKNAFSIQNNSSQHIDIQLINTLGVLLKNGRVEGNETSTYPIEGLRSGMYFLNVLQENKVVGVKKIVVE
jgi:Secretion system C-terminal sorting domain